MTTTSCGAGLHVWERTAELCTLAASHDDDDDDHCEHTIAVAGLGWHASSQPADGWLPTSFLYVVQCRGLSRLTIARDDAAADTIARQLVSARFGRAGGVVTYSVTRASEADVAGYCRAHQAARRAGR